MSTFQGNPVYEARCPVCPAVTQHLSEQEATRAVAAHVERFHR